MPLHKNAPYLIASCLFVVSVLVSSLIFFPQDVVLCWLRWAKSSGGSEPAAIYKAFSDCNYPPILLYMWTVGDATRQGIGAAPVSDASIFLTKLPAILAQIAGGLLCYRGLRGPWGEPVARRIAVVYLCNPALFLNAAPWGQFECLLSLALVAGIIAFVHDKPVWAGVAVGVGLAIKLQALIVIPAFAVFILRRYGLKTTVWASLACLGVLAAFCLPMLVTGGAEGLRASYLGAVDWFPVRTVGASNIWQLAYVFDIKVRHIPFAVAQLDSIPLSAELPFLTFKRLGLLLFGAYTVFLMAIQWRMAADTRSVILLSALSGFGFYMLPTQMHERYIVPSVALLVLLVGSSSKNVFRLYVYLTVAATVNQIFPLLLAWLPFLAQVPHWYSLRSPVAPIPLPSDWLEQMPSHVPRSVELASNITLTALAAANTAVFVAVTVTLWRRNVSGRNVVAD